VDVSPSTLELLVEVKVAVGREALLNNQPCPHVVGLSIQQCSTVSFICLFQQQIIWSKQPGQWYKSDDLFSQFSQRHKLDG